MTPQLEFSVELFELLRTASNETKVYPFNETWLAMQPLVKALVEARLIRKVRWGVGQTKLVATGKGNEWLAAHTGRWLMERKLQ